MHNHIIVLNTVKNVAKAPDYRDRTLNLPQQQTDNAGRIIENTRRLYCRSRTDIETAIAAIIQPPQNLMPKKAPQSQTQAKQWPVDASPKQPATTAPQPHNEQRKDDLPAKKKRTRTRKHNPSKGERSPIEQNTPKQPAADPTELRLR